MNSGKPKTQDMLKAEKLFDTWHKNEETKAKTLEDKLRLQLSTITLYVEAGFTGRDYLDEVANDWLAQDAQNAEEQGFKELAAEINAKIEEINKKLKEN